MLTVLYQEAVILNHIGEQRHESLWVRPGEQQGTSRWRRIPRQEEAIQRYAGKHGVTLEKVYQEEGISGTKGEADRPAFKEMVAAILQDGVRTVIVGASTGWQGLPHSRTTSDLPCSQQHRGNQRRD